jgi:hypothetical protein
MSEVFILAQFVGDKIAKTTAELATCAARIGEVTAIVLAPPGSGTALASQVTSERRFCTVWRCGIGRFDCALGK